MAAELLSPEQRRKVMIATLTNNGTLAGLLAAPKVIAGWPPEAAPTALRLVTVNVTPTGQAEGWAGVIRERYALDVWVDPDEATDPMALTDQIVAAIDGALTAAALRTTLDALGAPTIAATARRAQRWVDVPEPGESQATLHRSGQYEIEFVRR